eukprot:4170469-Pyramimonas_sp.AAC.1
MAFQSQDARWRPHVFHIRPAEMQIGARKSAVPDILRESTRSCCFWVACDTRAGAWVRGGQGQTL